MPTGTRKCKICGCEYPYCKTVTKNRFRYQDVACSPEHGAEYFRRIELSRAKDNLVSNYSTEGTEDEYDALFEEDFNNTAEEIEIEK